MRGIGVARRYAVALAASVLDNEFDRINSELESFLKGFQETKLGEVLVSYFIPQRKKIELVEEIAFKYKFHKKTRNFISLLVERKRIEFFPLIMQFFHQFWNTAHDIHEFTMITAVEVSDEVVRRIREILSKKFKGEIIIDRKLDPSIIGGVILQKGYIVYDGSIKKQLELIKRKIIEGE